MKQKTGKLTVITVLLLTVCIAAGAMGLPRLLGESISIPEAAEPALPGTALWVGMDELPLVISKEKASTDAVNPPQLSEREREKAEKEALRQLLIFARENRIETLYWQVADEEDYSRLELLCKAAEGSPAIWAAVKGDYAPAKKYWVASKDGSFTLTLDFPVGSDTPFTYSYFAPDAAAPTATPSATPASHTPTILNPQVKL